jgi:hypothetical protein
MSTGKSPTPIYPPRVLLTLPSRLTEGGSTVVEQRFPADGTNRIHIAWRGPHGTGYAIPILEDELERFEAAIAHARQLIRAGL